ncbi:MAG TPA: glycosyltransferase family 39 protein [Bacteroidales bacterium]|nr:glycosyltransferase family 39 protein [Bacteroidales bacterium]HPS62142.1 glycosyltransferase family 39 protein [Bacteroidales bacterium]
MLIPPATRQITGYIRRTWNDSPLVIILLLAALFRLLAAFFARGWGMLDDHYLIIEASQSWVFGHDYNRWLPSTPGNTGPSGHNFFYPGFHFLLFTLMKWVHLNDPQLKMLIVRLIHACFSMITVWLGYRITETLEGKKPARLAGILLALVFFLPWTSVRNLAESTCIPFVMLAFWQVIRPGGSLRPGIRWLLAGVFFGLAADLRYQLMIYPAGVALVMLFRQSWKETLFLVLGVFLSFFVVQALIDFFIWGYPFAEMRGYIGVNITDRNSYFNLPWYNYFLTVGGLLIPPVSLLLFYGFLRGWKDHLLIFIPAALFFLFHSAFPNKQERFILPFIPLFILLGSAGYYRYITPSGLWLKHRKLFRGGWVFFWIVNTILLTGLTFMYSKRAQVESMYYLSRYPYVSMFVIVDEKEGVPLAPLFYTGKWPEYPEKFPTDTTVFQRVEVLAAGPRLYHPQFFLFTGDRGLAGRVVRARKSFPLLVYETSIEPGFVDKLMHRLNPVNKANRIYIYRNREFYKTSIR